MTPNVLPPDLFYAALPALWTGCSPSTLINCQQFNSTQCNTIKFNSKYVHKLSRVLQNFTSEMYKTPVKHV